MKRSADDDLGLGDDHLIQDPEDGEDPRAKRSGVFLRAPAIRAAVDRIAREHGRTVRDALAGARLPGDAAEQIFSAAFHTLGMWMEANGHEPEDPAAMLLQIVRNHARNHRRRRVDEPLDEQALAHSPDGRPGAEEALDAARVAQRVRDLVEEMPPSKRAQIEEVDLAERPQAEVAAELGLTDEAERGRHRRALAVLGRTMTAHARWLGLSVGLLLAGAALWAWLRARSGAEAGRSPGATTAPQASVAPSAAARIAEEPVPAATGTPRSPATAEPSAPRPPVSAPKPKRPPPQSAPPR